MKFSEAVEHVEALRMQRPIARNIADVVRREEAIHIGFTGTRRYVDQERINALSWLIVNLRLPGASIFHHGDCVGMDEIAHGLAVGTLYSIDIHPPEDSSQRAFCHTSMPARRAKPYLKRNRDIVDASDILVAVPADPRKEELRSGTWSTVRYARKRGVPVVLA